MPWGSVAKGVSVTSCYTRVGGDGCERGDEVWCRRERRESSNQGGQGQRFGTSPGADY